MSAKAAVGKNMATKIIKGKSAASTALILVLLIGTVLYGCTTNTDQLAFYNGIVVANPDLSAIADGTYTGSYQIVPAKGKLVAQPYVQVQVQILDHQYVAIKVNAPPALRLNKQLANLGKLIIETQELSVDAATGATFAPGYTGKAFLKAVETALQ
ncbi:MAG: hypothetical protein KKI09_01875 [Spirochaetes bacterium]|nr:hypothetical protein [Spirochaetota bacterium]